MTKFTNYAILRNKDGPEKVYLEVTGVSETIMCRETEIFLVVTPRCMLESHVTEKHAISLIGKKAALQFERIFVQPYKVVHWPSHKVYTLNCKMGFRCTKSKKLLAVTDIKSEDIKTY